MKNYEDFLKKGKSYDTKNKLFNITEVKGKWLLSGDKQLYQHQLNIIRNVGYSAGKIVMKTLFSYQK